MGGVENLQASRGAIQNPLQVRGKVALVAEFEKSLIQERTSAGLKAARARGRVSGRPKVMDKKKLSIAGFL